MGDRPETSPAIGSAGSKSATAARSASRRHSTRNGLRWVAVNLALFVGTWFVVGGAYAATIMLIEGDGFEAPTSLSAILAVPMTIIVGAILSAITAAVGLMFLMPLVAPGLAAYLLMIWWAARAVPERWRRAAALALSPLIPVLVFVGAEWADLELAMLLGAAAYAAVLRLP